MASGVNDINPGDAGIVQDPKTGLRGIKDVSSGEVSWYQGNCRECGAAMYGKECRRKYYCTPCLTPASKRDGR